MANREVKRDVIINLKLAADASAKQQAQQLNRVMQEAMKVSKTPVDSVAKNVDKVLAKQKSAIDQLDAQRSRSLIAEGKRQEREALRLQRKAEVDRQKEIDSSARAAEKEAQKASAEWEKSIKAREAQFKSLGAEITAMEQKSQQAYRQLGSATKEALDGTLALTKGLVQVGAIGEQSAEKMLHSLIKIEAAFNSVKGGISVFFALRDAIDAARTSVIALDAAEQARAAKALLGGAAGGAVGKGAGNALGGTVGSALGGAAGGAATTYGGKAIGWLKNLATFGGPAGAGMFPTFAKHLPSQAFLRGAGAAGAQAAVAIGGGVILGNQLSKTRPFQDYASWVTGRPSDGKGTWATGMEAWRTARSAGKQSEKLSIADQKLQEERQRIAGMNQQIRDAAANDAGTRAHNRELASQRDAIEFLRTPGMSDEQKQSESSRREQLRAMAEIDQAQAKYDEAEKNRQERQKRGQFALNAEMQVAAQRMADAQRDRYQADVQALNIADQIVKKRREEVDALQGGVRAAEQALEAQREATKDRSVEFGRLDKGTQSRLADAAKRYAGGEELSRADIDLLENSGYGDIGAVKEARRKQGEAAGSIEFQNAFGLRDDEADAFEELSRAQLRLAQKQVEAASVMEDQAKAADRAVKAMNAYAEAYEKAAALMNGQGAPGGQVPVQPGGGQDVAAMGIGIGNSMSEYNREVQRGFRQGKDTLRRTLEQQAAQQAWS